MACALRHGIAAALVLLLGTLAAPGRGERPAVPEDSRADAEKPDKPDKDDAEEYWRETLLGELGGIRPLLARYGARLEFSETSEALSNPTGGRRQGVIYEGLTDLSLRVDLAPYFGAPGTVFARAYQIHGRGLTANYLNNLSVASGIEATRTTRLFELWYELPLADRVELRLGQQAASTEFLVSQSAQLFVNATFGWPNLPSYNLPSGGPNYPLATPAVRLKAKLGDEVLLLAGLYNGDPAGPGDGDPQLRDASGTAFRVNDGAFAIAELQYNPGGSERNGTYRLGGWFHSGRFADQRYDVLGLPLADPASSGVPRRHSTNYSLFATFDQPVLRNGDDTSGPTVFMRIMGAPGDRNLVDFYVDGGVAYAGPFGRKDDRIGVALAYTKIGGAARGADRDQARIGGAPVPVRSGETVLELTYRFQLTPWWQLQPDFQYVFNPGAGIVDPDRNGRRIRDAAVFGLRTTVTF